MPDQESTLEKRKSWIKWAISEYPKANKDEARVILAVTRKEDNKLLGVVGLGNKEEVDNEIEIAFFISERFSNKVTPLFAMQSGGWAVCGFGTAAR